jgi:hypothetical protein
MANDLIVKNDDLMAIMGDEPEWVKGLESDLIRPKFVRLYGHAAAALVPGGDKYIEGLKAGEYAIGSDKLVLGPKMRIVVCGTKKDYVELTAKPPEGKFVSRHTPEEFAGIKSVLAQDKDNPGRWYASDGVCFVETYILFVLDLDHLELGGLCMSFTSSGIKSWREIVGRTVQAKAKTEDGKLVPLAPWAVVWTIGSKTEQGRVGNPYLLPCIEGNFSILAPEFREIAKAAFDQVEAALKSGRVAVEDGSAAEE